MKKRYFIILILLSSSVLSYAQDRKIPINYVFVSPNKVPTEIKKKFKQDYPSVKSAIWSFHQPENKYEATFFEKRKLNNLPKRIRVIYNKQNNLVSITTSLSYKELSKTIADSVDKYFNTRAKKISKISSYNKEIYYVVETIPSESYETYTIIFSEKGKLIERHSIGVANH